MKRCIICHRDSTNPLKDFLSHFKLFEKKQFPYFNGTRRDFGLLTALRLLFPILRLHLTIKYRDKNLIIPGEEK